MNVNWFNFFKVCLMRTTIQNIVLSNLYLNLSYFLYCDWYLAEFQSYIYFGWKAVSNLDTSIMYAKSYEESVWAWRFSRTALIFVTKKNDRRYFAVIPDSQNNARIRVSIQVTFISAPGVRTKWCFSYVNTLIHPFFLS